MAFKLHIYVLTFSVKPIGPLQRKENTMGKKLILVMALCLAIPFIMAPGGTSPSDCSPGYWKNHQGDWRDKGCGGAIDDDTLLDMLTPQGERGDKQDRETAAALLNNCAAVQPNCR